MRYLTGFAAILVLAFTPLAQGGDRLDRQREAFLAAYVDLHAGRAIRHEELRRQLADYPLAPYLDYYRLRGRLSAAHNREVEAFLQQHSDLPVQPLLRNAWLSRLASRRDWERFARHYQPTSSATLQCHALQAQAVTGKIDAAWFEQARDLWLVGHSQPGACDPVFARLYDNDALSGEDAWRRVELAMAAGNSALAGYLGRYLDNEDRDWLRHWLAVNRQPHNALRRPGFDADHPRAGLLFAHAIRAVAARNVAGAWQAIADVTSRGWLSELQLAELQRDVALRAAYSRRTEAVSWLAELPAAAIDDEVLLWRAILARGEQDWQRLLAAIDELEPAERERGEWRYWKAYALERTGEASQANRLYRGLAAERHYYAFLAADALSLPYNMNPEPVRYQASDVAALAAQPGFERALELFRLELLSDARREWRAALSGLSREQLGHAAVLAAQAGWYDRAIVTANEAGLHNALELRFPTAFRDRIEYHSRRHQLELPLTFALLRKESAFMPDAVSSAGALGLMQVMPRTGREVARRQNERLPSTQALLDIDTNLRVGSAYLREVLDRFDNNPILATAAYNAGPHRVDQWLARNPDQPPTLWIENISFRETREYVKDVLAFSAVFDWQINGRKPRRITELMYTLKETETACTAPAFSLSLC